MNWLSERVKLELICLALLLILGLLTFTAIETVQAMRSFQKQYSAVKTGDVSTVHPWMTVHVISHVYHVPESYLGKKLTINNPDQLRHATLYEIAAHKKQPVNRIVRAVQQAILVYRKDHNSALFVQVPLQVSLIEPFLTISRGKNG
ncbi:MAG: hypothetical protein JO215_09425 [Ktedonobacteraceae bacterium]|nr:hypothetical protein [Ktedonobacteraceae bacterium]